MPKSQTKPGLKSEGLPSTRLRGMGNNPYVSDYTVPYNSWGMGQCQTTFCINYILYPSLTWGLLCCSGNRVGRNQPWDRRVQRTRLKWSPTHPWQHYALAPILSVGCRTRRLSSCVAQVDCQWPSYVTANRIVSSASAPGKALLEYLPHGAGRPPEIYR